MQQESQTINQQLWLCSNKTLLTKQAEGCICFPAIVYQLLYYVPYSRLLSLTFRAPHLAPIHLFSFKYWPCSLFSFPSLCLKSRSTQLVIITLSLSPCTHTHAHSYTGVLCSFVVLWFCTHCFHCLKRLSSFFSWSDSTHPSRLDSRKTLCPGRLLWATHGWVGYLFLFPCSEWINETFYLFIFLFLPSTAIQGAPGAGDSIS